MASTDHIASVFLRTLGAPDTRPMREAVKAWMRAEGISSSVARNNPWNLHQGAACGGNNDRGKFCPRTNGLPGQIGVYNAGPGDKNVAVFSTLDAGVAASANNLIRLSGSGYGYDRVIKYARAGDPVGFLNALARSSWSAGRYGTANGGANKLVVYYNQATGSNASPYSWRTLGGSSSQSASEYLGQQSSRPPATSNLGAWNNAISFPVGHVITVADVDKMMTALTNAGYFANDPGGMGASAARQILLTAVGKPWNKQLQDALQQQFAVAAKENGGLGALVASANSTLAKLTDPGTWARILGLVAGVSLIAYGGVNVYRATA